ncbi:MAG: glutamate synthase-related protein [Methanomassiliicoccales archaeon]|jgi:glutamate synthase domain-containing protein 2
MPKYRCNVCHVFEYEIDRGDSFTGIKPGTRPQDFPDDWRCHICGSDKTHLQIVEERTESQLQEKVTCPHCGKVHTLKVMLEEEEIGGYLARWQRKSDETEVRMSDIHRMSTTNESVIEPMRTKANVISWDDILVLGAQLAKIPLDRWDPVNTTSVIGPGAKKPMVLDMPVYVSHMSFGSLSRECKVALAKGSAAVGSAIGSGEGGLIEDEFTNAHRYIFEYVPNKYCVTEENLKRSHAIEIKIGQSVKPGMGGLLPAEKVTKEIAEIRGKPEGVDIISPASFPEIRDRKGLKKVVDMLKDVSGGRPIGIKLAAGHIEDDLAMALYAEPDFVTLDGRPGSTGASPKFVKDSSSVPTPLALHRARKFMDKEKADDVTLVITGGLRVSSDFAKALAMGADAVAIGTAALMAVGCQQYRVCDTGHCPVGITTQDPNLRARLIVDISARKVEHFLRVSNEELKDFARMTGNDDVHKLSVEDLCTVSSEISSYTDIRHA